MQMLIYIAFGFLLGIVFAKWRFETQLRAHNASNPVNQQRAEERRKHLEQIMDYLDSHDQVANDDVEKMLAVSNATAERYLNEMEQQGKLAQVGRTGRNVIYKKI